MSFAPKFGSDVKANVVEKVIKTPASAVDEDKTAVPAEEDEHTVSSDADANEDEAKDDIEVGQSKSETGSNDDNDDDSASEGSSEGASEDESEDEDETAAVRNPICSLRYGIEASQKAKPKAMPRMPKTCTVDARREGKCLSVGDGRLPAWSAPWSSD